MRFFSGLFFKATFMIGFAGCFLRSLTAADPNPAPVAGISIGWCTSPTPAALGDAKAAGFQFVELALQEILNFSDAEFTNFQRQLEASGMVALSGYNPVPKEIKLVGADAIPAKQDVHLQRLVERAAALKMKFLIFNSGASWRIPPDFSQKVAGAQLIDFSRRFAKLAAERSIMVLVQPQRSVDSNQVTSVATALKLVELVDHPNFQLAVDYSFLQTQKNDLASLRAAKDHLRHVHIANPSAAGRVFPLDAAESDYAAFFAVLNELRYHGAIGVHAATNAFATDAPRAIHFLRHEAQTLLTP